MKLKIIAISLAVTTALAGFSSNAADLGLDTNKSAKSSTSLQTGAKVGVNTNLNDIRTGSSNTLRTGANVDAMTDVDTDSNSSANRDLDQEDDKYDNDRDM